MRSYKNLLFDLYAFVIIGKQKAVVAGAVAGALSLLAMVGVSGQMTVKEALYALCNWLLAHLAVYYKANKN